MADFWSGVGNLAGGVARGIETESEIHQRDVAAQAAQDEATRKARDDANTQAYIKYMAGAVPGMQVPTDGYDVNAHSTTDAQSIVDAASAAAAKAKADDTPWNNLKNIGSHIAGALSRRNVDDTAIAAGVKPPPPPPIVGMPGTAAAPTAAPTPPDGGPPDMSLIGTGGYGAPTPPAPAPAPTPPVGLGIGAGGAAAAAPTPPVTPPVMPPVSAAPTVTPPVTPPVTAPTPPAMRDMTHTERTQYMLNGAIRFGQKDAIPALQAELIKSHTDDTLAKIDSMSSADKSAYLSKVSGHDIQITPNKVVEGQPPTFSISVNGEMQDPGASASGVRGWIQSKVDETPELGYQAYQQSHKDQIAEREANAKIGAYDAQIAEIKQKIGTAQAQDPLRTQELTGQLKDAEDGRNDVKIISDPQKYFIDNPVGASDAITRIELKYPKDPSVFGTRQRVDAKGQPMFDQTGKPMMETFSKVREAYNAAQKTFANEPQKARLQYLQAPDGTSAWGVKGNDGKVDPKSLSRYYGNAVQWAHQTYGNDPMPGMPGKAAAPAGGAAAPRAGAPAAAAPAAPRAAPAPAPAPTPVKAVDPDLIQPRPGVPLSTQEVNHNVDVGYLHAPGRATQYAADKQLIQNAAGKSRGGMSGFDLVGLGTARSRVQQYEAAQARVAARKQLAAAQ